MTQDRDSGADADAFGRNNALVIAEAIGANLASPHTSNEAVYEGRKTVLKSAKSKTTKVGVTYLMLERLDSVIGAFEQDDGRWLIIELDAAEYRQKEKVTMSQGKSSGKVGVVAKSVFLEKGRHLGVFAF